VLRIVNDDGEIRHHAYIQSPDFSFDSGDQEPGQHTDINFTAAGRFAVLCGIHPRMRLVVAVR
jgi:plastocyanin